MVSATGRGPLRRILVNVGFITGSNLLGRLANLLLHAALGRFFGAEGLGGYSTAVAIAGYFVFVVDFGLSPRLVREGAVSPDRLDEEYADALGLKLVTAVGALAALGLLCLVLPYEPAVIELVFLLSVASIVRSFSYLNESVCRSRERLDLEGASGLLHAVAFVGSSLVCLAAGLPVEVVGYTSVGAALFQLFVSSALARRFVRIGVRLPPHFEAARLALPYATTSLAVLAFSQLDILLVSMIETQEFVGRYASVSRLLAIAGTLGALAGASALPTAARVYANADVERFQWAFNEGFRCVLLIAGGAGLGFLVLAKPLIRVIYGPDFADLYPFLQLGSVFIVVRFAVSGLSTVLTSCGRQSLRARSIMIGLVATVVFVLALVPRFGIAGAVLAMIASELVLLSCFTWFVRDHLRASSIRSTVLVLVVSVPATAYLYFELAASSGTSSGLLSIVLPLVVYAGAIAITGEARRALRFLSAIRQGGASPPT